MVPVLPKIELFTIIIYNRVNRIIYNSISLLQSSSESHIVITSTEFMSGTTNVITASKVSEGTITTLYENISVRLESIMPAASEPPDVKDPEPASMFIGRWLIENSMEDHLSLEI